MTMYVLGTGVNDIINMNLARALDLPWLDERKLNSSTEFLSSVVNDVFLHKVLDHWEASD